MDFVFAKFTTGNPLVCMAMYGKWQCIGGKSKSGLMSYAVDRETGAWQCVEYWAH